MNIALYNKRVFVPIDGDIPRKNKIFILNEENQKFEFLVTEVGQLSWAKHTENNKVVHGILVDFVGVYGDKVQ